MKHEMITDSDLEANWSTDKFKSLNNNKLETKIDPEILQ
jgi:hypothetical protein